MFQIMAKHKQHVKNIMLGTCELHRDMFITEQDVKVLFGKLDKKNTNYIKTMQKMCICGFNKTPIQCFTIKKLG